MQVFASEVEAALQRGGTSLVKQVCRHVTGENEKVSAFMTAKLVEWWLGKAVQTVRSDNSDRPLGLGFDEPASKEPTRVC